MEAKDFKRKRGALGLTQAELAEILDVQPNTVSRYETGTMDIPKVVALALETVERQQQENENAVYKSVSSVGDAPAIKNEEGFVGGTDSFEKVEGKDLDKMRNDVQSMSFDVLEKICLNLNCEASDLLAIEK